VFRRQTLQESNFDSVMRPAATGIPAQLSIRLKVVLLARDPSGSAQWGKGIVSAVEYLSRLGEEPHTGKVADGDGRLWDCRSWYDAEFNAFRIKFKRMVELAWNNQLILLPQTAAIQQRTSATIHFGILLVAGLFPPTFAADWKLHSFPL
jgi:hypothetical protein